MSEPIDYKSLYETTKITNLQLTEQNLKLIEQINTLNDKLDKYNTLYVAKTKFNDVINGFIKLTDKGVRVDIHSVSNDLAELCELFSKAFK